ncbi:MAG: hypothetical protein ACPL4K_02585 [Candidatus Margulisiibacteriota bacterium]
MTECTLISSFEYQVKPTKPHKTQSPRSKEETFNCPSIEDAVLEILNKEDPNIIAFGERHPRGGDDGTKKTTLKLFADKILPILAKHGYQNLVFEELFSDPEADKAAAQYFRGERTFEDLEYGGYFYSAPSVNYYGVKELFRTAKDLKVQIFGGGPSKNDPEIYYDMSDPEIALDWKYVAALVKKVNKGSQQKILKLLKQGKTKVASYGGGEHNDIVDRSPTKGFNFGKFFKFKTRFRYTEVDLLSPELMGKGRYKDYAYPEYERWLKSAVPQQGVNLIKRGNSSFTIIFPAGTLER